MMLPPSAAPLQLVSPLRGWPPGLEVALLRSDLVHGLYGGNKYYKLYYNLLAAAEAGLPLLTFGGAFSNHIAAVAAAAREAGIAATGIIRGDELDASSNEVLRFATSCGMQLHFVSRTEYRRRHDAAYHRELEAAFGSVYLVPEGGTNALAVRGFQHILPAAAAEYDHIFTACGTGGTLAGLAAAAHPHQHVTGIAAVNDAATIDARVAELLQPYPNTAAWQLNSNFTFGGYARTAPELEAFCREVSAFWNVPLEPVYTGKLMFAVDALVGRGELGRKILILCSNNKRILN
jgi:1-aminocyclopropane-1-carboxylate deaminase